MFRKFSNSLVAFLVAATTVLTVITTSIVVDAVPAYAACPTGQIESRGSCAPSTTANNGTASSCPAGQIESRGNCVASTSANNGTASACATGYIEDRGSCVTDEAYAARTSGVTATTAAPQSVSGSGLTAAPNYGDLHPDQNALPGGSEAATMLGGLMFYAILFTLGGMMVSMGVWAVGSFSSNYTQAVNGKRSALICFGSAFFIGAAYGLVNWFFTKGQSVS